MISKRTAARPEALARLLSAIGASEALRRSMMALIEYDNGPWMSHPLFWAPFVVVGEGARHQM
jgi:CHAT domain-containing protein